MKRVILVMDEDIDYSKKFCSQANKLYGKKYTFLTFANTSRLKEYASNEKVESIIISKNHLESVEDIICNSIYILNEIDKNVSREGKKVYVFKLQNIKNILEIIDNDIEKRYEHTGKRNQEKQKLIVFYSPTYIKNKEEIVKRFAKYLGKKKKVLIVGLDEFENYKGNVGLSNIIFDYKENEITLEKLEKEIVNDKNQDYIKSVTYPEDFNVISNIDLANIISEITRLPYDYILINADMSYTKCQYILNDADNIILLKENSGEKVDKFKMYLKTENNVDFKKVNEINVGKLDRSYMTNLMKQIMGSNNYE